MANAEFIYPDLNLAKQLIYDACGYNCSHLSNEPESREYSACTFTLNNLAIKFRAAKITPTKIGQFVTLWKRDDNGITKSHDDSDPIDLFVINTRKGDLFGQFVFTKDVLIKHGILSISLKEGKRGFRVYPPWDTADNKQARKTQKWQLDFFLEVTADNIDFEKVNRLYAINR
jgi:hypothetical protein